MRRIATIAAAVMVIASIAAPAVASTPPEGGTHIALGDSAAAGSGANNPDRTAYVDRLNRWLRSVDCAAGAPAACPGLELSDYAVGGAKTGDLIEGQLPEALAEIAEKTADADPTNDVVYITITIGGNDLFGPVIAACGGGVTDECRQVIGTVFGAVQANLAQILIALRTAAPQAQIAIMTYYNPLGSCYLADLAPLADTVLEGGSPLPFGLNDIIRGVADQVGGVTVVETYGLLGAGDYVGGEDCLHPDDSGHRKIAMAFLGALS